MSTRYTKDQLLALLEIPSSADCLNVYDALCAQTNAPLSWDAPGDEAEYITDLRIGQMGDARSLTVTFSKHGNLCFVDLPNDPLLDAPLLESILRQYGWSTVSLEDSRMPLYSESGETVHDRFFSYV